MSRVYRPDIKGWFRTKGGKVERNSTLDIDIMPRGSSADQNIDQEIDELVEKLDAIKYGVVEKGEDMMVVRRKAVKALLAKEREKAHYIGHGSLYGTWQMGHDMAIEKAHNYLYFVHDEPKDGHIMDKWLERHYD